MIVELGRCRNACGRDDRAAAGLAPFRALIGYKSDIHKSALGWRRVPYTEGTMLQFGGFAIMPFALLCCRAYQEAADAPAWIGQSAAALAFLLVGAGVHTVQTVALALATDLVEVEATTKGRGPDVRHAVVGMIGSAPVLAGCWNPTRRAG